jgi:hypothetical protein
MPRFTRTLRPLFLCVVLTVAAGCGRHAGDRLTGLPNQPPTVTMKSAKLGAGANAAFDLRWMARDPDGVVDHYLVTTELRALSHSQGWVPASETSKFLRPSRVAAMAARSTAREPDFFAVRAVDDRGAISEPAWFAAFGDSLPPTVQILSPPPSVLSRVFVQPSVFIDFDGDDPDGSTGKPVKYKYRLFGPTDAEMSIATILVDPDSLRRFYAPAFAGWDSVPNDSSFVQYQNLVPGTEYLFAVVAIDENGLYSPVFSRNSNLLWMRVHSSDAALVGLHVFGETFVHEFDNTTPPYGVIAALNRALTINWLGTPPAGGFIQDYRSALDPDTLDGSGDGFTPWDVHHTSRRIGPFLGSAALQSHRLVIEARSDQGFTARAIILLHPSYLTNEKELLIVDDTRRLPDRSSHLPQLEWPTAAELDSFLYARGGYPWQFYPSGTMSTPGLFAGYPFDTVGTRTGTTDPMVPYETLRKYRHVVWITDGISGSSTGTPASSSPMSALRFMSAQFFSPLTEYVRAGGRLWIVGGGAGKALMGSFDRVQNNQPVPTYSNANGFELIPGRFMYDVPHWISEFRSAQTVGETVIQRGGDVSAASNLSPGFDVSRLPAALEYRQPDTDPLPPLRSAGQFYVMNNSLEWISQPNAYRGITKQVALDTLMQATLYGGLPGTFPCMTAVSGPVNGTLVFSGFDLWSWRRAQCAQVIDAVLNGYWGLQRSAPVARPATEASMRPATLAKPANLAAARRQ